MGVAFYCGDHFCARPRGAVATSGGGFPSMWDVLMYFLMDHFIIVLDFFLYNFYENIKVYLKN